MLSINNLSYYIGGRPLYENASLHIKPRDKIGLVGINGFLGKSPLLKIIYGDIHQWRGEHPKVTRKRLCSIGFLKPGPAFLFNLRIASWTWAFGKRLKRPCALQGRLMRCFQTNGNGLFPEQVFHRKAGSFYRK